MPPRMLQAFSALTRAFFVQGIIHHSRHSNTTVETPKLSAQMPNLRRRTHRRIALLLPRSLTSLDARRT